MKRFGDLTDDELYELVDRMENEDEDLRDALRGVEKAEKEEDIPEPAEEPARDDADRKLEAYYGTDAWRLVRGEAYAFGPEKQRRANVAAAEAVRRHARSQRKKRLDVQRMAFDQDTLPLASEIRPGELKELVGMLTQEQTRMAERCKAYIDRRLTALLNPFIPRGLRVCMVKYPRSIRRSPGFLYVAGPEYGQGRMVWATPDIPDWLPQGTERKVLEDVPVELKMNLDKAVARLYEYKEKAMDKGLKYASMLVRKRVRTYYDLLKLNPFWFELLYHAKKAEDGK